MVEVYRSTSSIDAELIAGHLRDEGIDCFVDGAGQAALAGVLEVKVLVRAADVSRAESVIEANS
jgi:hypothetical protein